MEKTPMTVAGAEKLRKDLEFLKSVERPRISNAIAEAREHGDLSENAEYAAAREEQEGRRACKCCEDLFHIKTVLWLSISC